MRHSSRLINNMDKAKLKKIVIIAAVFLVLVLAVATSLSVLKVNQQGKYSGGTSSLPGAPINVLQKAERSADSALSVEESTALPSEAESPAVEKKVIKNGSLTAKVVNIDNSVKDIEAIAKSNSGEVFSTNFYQNANKAKSGTIVVKVPVTNFEKAFAELKKVASVVVRESTSGQDVTQEYTDLQSQLKNKQAEEQAFASILSRSGQIDDVLKVTKELARVRGEIEVLQGQIKYLNSQIDMSQISLNLSEDENITVTDTWRPGQIIKDAVNSLIQKIQKFLSFIIVLVIIIIPILALYLLLFYIFYLIGKKIYRKIRKKNNSVGETKL